MRADFRRGSEKYKRFPKGKERPDGPASGKAYFSDLAVWNLPSGGFFIWLRLKGKVLAQQVFESALKEKILVPPGSIYEQIVLPVYVSATVFWAKRRWSREWCICRI